MKAEKQKFKVMKVININVRFLVIAIFSITISSILLLNGCSLKKLERELIQPESIAQSYRNLSTQEDKPILKIHMLNGSLYVLSQWTVDSLNKIVDGYGKLFDPFRNVLGNANYSVNIDSVAIFETNKLNPSHAIAPLTIITGISVGMTIFCITNPKSCFGSCPTIYTYNDGHETLQAEGFSASIAPSLEDYDIDALHARLPNEKEVRLYVKNEALETHVIRSMDLLAVPKDQYYHVYYGIDSNFHHTQNLLQPKSAMIETLDCLEKVSLLDEIEYYSTTDSNNLAEKEMIDLCFNNVSNDNLGLVIGCRQSLLSTYLLYTGLGYLGTHVGNWMAEMERGSKSARNSAGNMGRILGGIDVLIKQDDGKYTLVGTVNETGPLAIDVHLVPFMSQSSGKELNIRLRLTKGHWRIDYISLVRLEDRAVPLTIHPSKVINVSDPDNDLRLKLLDSTLTLTTFPGDEYVLVYDLPDLADRYELFVKSRGYYIEWMRDEWVVAENMTRAAQMFLSPQSVLRDLAPEFKHFESEMENIFWNSKYAK